MRVLVTGAAGFSGLHLLRFLEKLDVTTACLVRRSLPALGENKNRIFVRGDIEDVESLENICQKFSPEIVFHLAGLNERNTNFDTYQQTQRINFMGTLNLLEALRKTCPQTKVLIVSSSAGYETVQKNESVAETSPLYPVSAHGLSKLGQELLGYQYFRHFNLPVFIVRSFNLIGVGQRTDEVCSSIASQISKIEKGLCAPVLKIGNLDSKRDFLDVRNAVSAYWKVVTEGEPGIAYNVCSGKVHSIKEVIEILAALSRRTFEIHIEESRKRAVEVKALCGDNQQLKDLGWRPQISFQESLAGLLDYWRQGSERPIQLKGTQLGRQLPAEIVAAQFIGPYRA